MKIRVPFSSTFDNATKINISMAREKYLCLKHVMANGSKLAKLNSHAAGLVGHRIPRSGSVQFSLV